VLEYKTVFKLWGSYIVLHYLKNPGKIPFKIIEAQNEKYLEKDDIIRFEND